MPNALPAEEKSISVHVFPGKSDGEGLELPEIGSSLYLCAAPSPVKQGAGRIHSFSYNPELSCTSTWLLG